MKNKELTEYLDREVIKEFIKSEQPRTTKLQESNEKYLDGFVLYLMAEYVKTNGFTLDGPTIPQMAKQYNKLNRGNK